jgi:hypothetical protein
VPGWQDFLRDVVRSAADAYTQKHSGEPASPAQTTPASPAEEPGRATTTTTADTNGAYPGDYEGLPKLSYAPHPDKWADPGEVVWAWVPYEEDHSQGKDRPSLVVGKDGAWLLALPLTSVDHDLDHDQEAREGRYWVGIGAGDWDSQGRPSFVRVDRIVRIAPTAVRRVGGQIDEATFDDVATGLKKHWAD